MIIRRLSASFGNLNSRELSLTGGLNIIEAPNESGKSTWCAFIRAMLYGINTSARDKQGALSDKTRYRPWSGAPMEGTMDVYAGGRSISLRRTGTAASPMKRFSAVYADTGESAPFSGDEVGEALTGASESVFERTAFIRQSGLRVEQAYELEKRISSLVSSGDEHTSYTEAEEKLRSWSNSLRHNKTGSLPKLEAQRSAAAERLVSLEDGAEAIADARREANRLEALRRQLESDLKAHDLLEARAKVKRVSDARARLDAAEKNLLEARAEAERAGAPQEAVDDVKNATAALGAVAPVYSRAKEECVRAGAAYESALAAKNAHVMSKLTEAEAAEKAEKARELARERYNPAPKLPKALIIISAAVAVAALILMAALRSSVGYTVGVVALLAAASVMLVFMLKRTSAADNGLNELLCEFGCADEEALSALSSEYSALCRALENASSAQNAARQSMDSASAAARESEARLMNAAKAAFPHLESAAEIPDAVRRAEAASKALSSAEAEEKTARSLFEAVSASSEPVPDEAYSEEYVQQPLRSRSDTLTALAKTDAQLISARGELDRRTGELRAFGAPELISGNIEALDAEIAEQSLKYAALSLARETLAEASTDMRTRFSPIISSEAGTLMSRLTGGRYERLSFDRAFSAEARSRDGAVAHSALSLSAGTVDQLYLALRLAMCRLLLSGAEPCPVILDDALASFDDERAAEALRLLRELSSERQVLLFTCHTREAAILSGQPGINIVRPD